MGIQAVYNAPNYKVVCDKCVGRLDNSYNYYYVTKSGARLAARASRWVIEGDGALCPSCKPVPGGGGE
jgi:hypothetical protein